MTEPERSPDAIIRHHSRSFALASRLLPADVRRDAVAVYAWCRRVDDAVDLAEEGRAGEALRALHDELALVYTGGPVGDDPVLVAFQGTVRRRGVPERYAQDLLAGMAMDVAGRRYATLSDLLDYCYHVAGCVGLMMCHVMGLNDDTALPHAAHLGIAMQLTNICRDVGEDWDRGRLYLPEELLGAAGAEGVAERIGSSFPESARRPAAVVTDRLLEVADHYYASGDRGLPALSWACSVAIRAARTVYSAIGSRVRAQGCDPLAERAFVGASDKLILSALAVAASLPEMPARLLRGTVRRTAPPGRVLAYPDDVLPRGTDLPGAYA